MNEQREPCWRQLGRLRPTVPNVLPLVRSYYIDLRNSAGGSLHIVLDDGNVEDDNVRFCIQWARDHDDEYGERLGLILLCMSQTQRHKLYQDSGKHRMAGPILGYPDSW